MGEREDLSKIVVALLAALERHARQGHFDAPLRPTVLAASATACAAPIGPERQSEMFGSTPREVPRGSEGLRVVREELGDCVRCKLCKGRTQIVFGVGNPQADVVFVGEGPGRDEDEQGEPFVGRAGQLLTRMIAAMGLARQDVYICNVVKCRPPDNRNPEPDEVAACEPFLRLQLEAIRPRLIVALGNFAVQTLLRTRTGITSMHGRFHVYQGIALMPTYHPAFLLRSPHMKKSAWEDLQKVMAEMDRLGLPRNRNGQP